MTAARGFEIVGEIPGASGSLAVVVACGGTLFRMESDARGRPLADVDALAEIARVGEQDPEAARSMGRSLEDLGAGIYPLSMKEALALVPVARWRGSFAPAPAAEIVGTYQESSRPIRIPLLALLVTVLAVFFAAAAILIPAVAARVGIRESSVLSGTVLLLLNLLLLDILLASRSILRLGSWCGAVWSLRGPAAVVRELHGRAARWAWQSGVLLGILLLLVYYLARLVFGGVS